MDEVRARAGNDTYARGDGVDVDLVLLRSFGLEADYVDLEKDVLGRTLFGPTGPVEIQVNRALAEEAEHSTIARRRLRTTLAHETGHVACHSSLFIADTQTLPLFPTSESTERAPGVLCRENTVGHGYSGDWVEYQANQCMASLLMPRKLFASELSTCLEEMSLGSYEEAILADRGRDVWRWLCHAFDVNERATHYRLKELGYIRDGGQGRLGFN